VTEQTEPVVTRRGEAAYDEALRASVWQARKPHRFPDAIVRASTSDHVVAAVSEAVANGQRVAVRTGGHNFHGLAVPDGGVLIDASGLDTLSVDAASRTAVAGPGVTGLQLGEALDDHGLAFPAPHDHSVAVGGFLLAGGFGLNAGAWGPSCFSVEAVEVVTAGGELIAASEHEHADYLWAARGAGAMFPGIVTSFRLALRPRPAVMRLHTYVYAANELPDLSRYLSVTLPRLHPSIEAVVVLAPGRVVVRVCAWAADMAEGSAMVEPFETHSRDRVLHRQVLEPKSLVELTAMLYPPEARLRPENRRAVEAFWTDAAIDEVLPALGACLERAPSKESRVLAVLHSRPATRDREAVFSMWAAVNVEPSAVWSDPADDDVNLDWSAAANATAARYAVGHYIASADLSVDAGRAGRCFGERQWERLQEFRRTVDPDDVFHSLP
jgi:FAD/FMN-containing dehydrogenase